MLFNNYATTYDSLLAKANKPSTEIKRYWTLALEIFKTLNDLNPTYMQDLFLSTFPIRKTTKWYSRCKNKYKHVWNEKP